MLDRIKKRQIDGFKEFVINMESSGPTKRGQIFTAGVLEDPVYMMFVMKNIRSFEDFLQLDSDELDTILGSQAQILQLFAKCLFGTTESKLKELENNLPKIMPKVKEELTYIKAVSPTEVDGAKIYLLKTTRKLMQEERVHGFRWKLPPQDVYYPKTYKDGNVKIHFENGIIAAEGMYLKGKRMGTWKHNYDMGNLLAEGDYFDGLKEGVWTFYYSTGKIKAKGKYRNDMKQGNWKEYDRNGNASDVEYHEGLKKEA